MISDTSRSTLPADHWQALNAASDILIDEFSEDIGRLVDDGDGDFETTWMSNYLPPQFHQTYTALFAKKVLVCVVVVAWKLEQPMSFPLACVGEQLALRALIERAEVELEMEGREADFTDFWEMAYPDTDILMLFDPAMDGIEDSDIGDYLGTRSLAPKDWFDPLYDTVPVHPYVAEDP